tara:strand:- start:24 stop:599 length:576 start_codon:yes stop_codon:yes gene_type:complete
MAYDIKNVFYLDTTLDLVNGAGGGASTQLDLSAYVDPIARGRSKGTGLAIYKTHFSVDDSGSNDPVGVTETGYFRAALIAGLGVGDNAVSAIAFANNTINAANDLAVAGFDWYGADAFGTGVYSMSPSMTPQLWLEPSEKVPYVIVRDNVCLVAEVGANLSSAAKISCRIECAQVSLDQATLNQLLRTQTV